MSLAESRLRVFLAQYERQRGYGWQSDVARKTGIHQTHVGRIKEGERGASPATIEAVQRAFHIAPEYFSDASLGETPDYRQFTQDAPTTLERDVHEMRAVTEYFEKHPDRALWKSRKSEDFATLREHVNAVLNGDGGDLPFRTVRTVIDDMIEEFSYE